MGKLREENAEYAVALKKASELFANIEPIIESERQITISAMDCLNFREFLDQELTVNAAIEGQLYRQGYLDCVKLLSMLGVLK